MNITQEQLLRKIFSSRLALAAMVILVLQSELRQDVLEKAIVQDYEELPCSDAFLPMDIVEILRSDYRRFPKHQTYSIYAKDIYFKDPMSQYRGLPLYKAMIKFIDIFFLNCRMDLHDIQQLGNEIKMEWTLSWNSPLPWKPSTKVDGWSELKLNDEGMICSHIDYWRCSRLDVLKQQFPWRQHDGAKTDKVKEM